MKKFWIEKKPEIRKFTIAEASWLAGVIDGEGSIGLYDYGKEGRRVMISMGNTNESFVREMRRIIGCGSQVNRSNWHATYRHKGLKPMFLYSLKGSSRCYWVLTQIVKYLIIKKQKALDIIRELETKPFGRWANATEENRKAASIKITETWKNPEIRARRIAGMKKAQCRKHS